LKTQMMPKWNNIHKRGIIYTQMLYHKDTQHGFTKKLQEIEVSITDFMSN